jgi:hypothetical protein
MSVSYDGCVVSGRGVYEELITVQESSIGCGVS